MRLVARLALDASLESLAVGRALFLDTETSGLGGAAANRAFLVGLSWFDQDSRGVLLEQLLLRDLDDEVAMLEHVRARMEAASFLVTYNGKSFDLPLLRARALLARVGPLPERPHLDLLHVARRVHGRRVGPVSLGVVERRVLGYDRGPDISGEEVAMRYAEYRFTGDEGPLEEVLVHNLHDLRSLVGLLGHYGFEATGAADDAHAPDLGRMAHVLRRAGDLDWAKSFADRAVSRSVADGEGAASLSLATASEERDAEAVEALRTRAEIARMRGERRASAADLETLLTRAEDPAARLALAKLYEHHLRDPSRALELVEQGTSENAEETAVRRARLLRKVARKGP